MIRLVIACWGLGAVLWPEVAARAAGERPTGSADDRCHPSYDPCVPIASDVDCAGGGGNGPVFVQGPVKVIGPDAYRLDSDGNGIGCER